MILVTATYTHTRLW